MVASLQIDSNIQRTRDDLGKVISGLPDVQDDMTKDLARVLSEKLQSAIQSENLTWRQNLYSMAGNVNKTSQGANKVTYSINLPQYAYYLENMDPHYVNPYNHPRLMQWAREKLSIVPSPLYVRPHPFIKPAMQQAYSDMSSYLADGGKMGEYINKQLG